MVGKLLGIFGASPAAVRIAPGTLPRRATRQLAAAAANARIGFTIALSVSTLAFTDRAAQDEAKVWILAASAAAAALGWLLVGGPFR